MISKITIDKLSIRNNNHNITVTPINYDPKTQRLLVSLNNKVAETILNEKTGNLIAKIEAPVVNSNNLNTIIVPDVRVKVFVYDFINDKILGAKLQEFKFNLQQFEYEAIDELLTTSPVIIGNWDKPIVLEINKFNVVLDVYNADSFIVVCINDEIFQHKFGTTYFDLQNKGIVLNKNYRPYAFITNGTKPETHIGQIGIIENIETGQLFYPRKNEKGYMAFDAYGKFNIKFDKFIYSNKKGIRIFADNNLDFYVNDKLIGRFKQYKDCVGLPKTEGYRANIFTINEKTFKLPDEFSVIALDENAINDTMPVLIDNDRRINRDDKEDTISNNDLEPSNDIAKDIYKEIATLWNHYEDALYVAHLTPTPDVIPIPMPNLFEIEKSILNNKKLLMPSLIKDGTLPNITEQFIKDFFENKIKGFTNLPKGLKSLYSGNGNKFYEQAGSNLVQHFFSKTGEPYYKTKTIADAIYKTENGKEAIDNMIKLVDQIFQYQLSKPKEKLNSKDFLEKPLDNNWFELGIDPETFPSFEAKSVLGTDEEMVGLFCIGGTQKAKVVIKTFKPVSLKENIGYKAEIIINYVDTFGVSQSDYTKKLPYYSDIVNSVEYNYRGGVMAQWILQHQYDYKPFNDYLTYIVKMNKIWKR